MYPYIYIYIYIYKNIVTVIQGDPKALFSVATALRCRGGRYSFLRIAPHYP